MNPRENIKEKRDLHNEILREVKDLKQILVNHIKSGGKIVGGNIYTDLLGIFFAYFSAENLLQVQPAFGALHYIANELYHYRGNPDHNAHLRPPHIDRNNLKQSIYNVIDWILEHGPGIPMQVVKLVIKSAHSKFFPSRFIDHDHSNHSSHSAGHPSNSSHSDFGTSHHDIEMGEIPSHSNLSDSSHSNSSSSSQYPDSSHSNSSYSSGNSSQPNSSHSNYTISSHSSHSDSPDDIETGINPMHNGKGIVSSTTDFIKSVGRKSKEIVGKVISGNTGLPPAVKKILDKHGNQLIKEITIVRNPVGSALVSALSVASMGEFKKNLKASPYDKLFHLKLVITLQNGMKVSLEKVERVSMTMNPKKVKGEEELSLPVSKQLTLDQLYHNGEMRMGDKFYPYSARDNNCQDFVMGILEGSGLAGGREKEFIKQNTTDLFGDDAFVRKLSNTLTDVGARFNVLLQGGAIKGIFRKKKGKGVFPPMYEKPDFIQLPTFLQNDALAKGNAPTTDDSSDTTVEDGMGIDFDEIEWGSFKKAFYNRQKKYKHINSLGAYAKYIMEHPDNFNKHTKKRANFYLNVLRGSVPA